jgi:large subunit ribosomal protein L6e
LKEDLCLRFVNSHISGPYKVNGVPLRRICQTYAIATSTVLDISKVTLPDNLDDDYFKREPKKKKRSEDMFEDTQEVGRNYSQ